MLKVKSCSDSNTIDNLENIPLILVGNKCDLTDQRKVSEDMARDCARQWNVPYIETSAKTRHNVQKVFFDILLMIDKKKENDRKLALDSGPNTSNTLCTRCMLL